LLFVCLVGVFVLMMPFFQLLHIVVKLLVWTDGGAALSVRPGMHRDTLLFITGLIFCCWLSSWGCMLATIFSSTTYGAYVAASVLISVSFLLELVLLRFVQNDKITKGVLQVVTTSNGGNRCFGRRHTGVVSVALTYEDAKDAKHLIWDSRIDITSLSAGRPNSMILQ
jgi:ABC-type transport system involved in multi-copper enzyme maturation permease subunit